VAVAPAAFAADPETAPIPVRDFVRPAEYDDAKLSPTGKYLAVAMRRDGKKVVAVLTLDTLAVASIVKFNEPNEAYHFHWANDERLLVSLATMTPVLDFPVATGELYAVDADGSNGLMIFGRRAADPKELSGIRTAADYHGVHRITSLLPDDPRHVLITTYDDNGGREQITNGALLDVYTGALQRVTHAPLRDAFLLADPAGVIRFAMGRNKNLEYELYYKQDAKAAWTRVTTSAFGSGELIPIGFTSEPNKVFVLDNRSTATRGLFVLDLTTGNLETTFRDPRVDIDSVLVAQPDGVVYGARYVPAAVAYYFVDAAQPFAGILRAAQQHFPGAYIDITSFTRDRARALVHVISDRDAGMFYLYDARDGTFKYQLASRRWLDPDRMASVRAVDIAARDGQLLQGFVTTPLHWVAPGPVVVMPHGGPHGAKDGPLFDATAQLLAHYGYAVLTVNYRGSDGYGAAFKAAGFGQWGGVIQHDITDATRWAIANGLADPRRIAIFGTSFGAYAAMMNPILEPGLYRCAIGLSGVYDLPLMFETGDIKRRGFGLNYLRKVIGEDRATLESISPVQNVGRLTVPVLLAHGGADTHTPVIHARRLRDALLAAGDDVEYIEEPREAHDFLDPDNRAALFERILAFLQLNLAVPAPL
jgi:dipeptidyl aminopeptidase/acylaminoacyl peptidase